MIRYDSQVMYLPLCETYVLMGGPGGLAPWKFSQIPYYCIGGNKGNALLHQDDIPQLIEMT